ncbi:MAG: hypothetical protein ABSD74_20865, partial [Rhizomicrobium sp.]
SEVSPTLLRDLSAYRDCIDRNVSLVDDGQADAAEVAKTVAQRCAAAYQKFVTAAAQLAKSEGGPVGIVRNSDAALVAVQKERRAKSAPKSN